MAKGRVEKTHAMRLLDAKGVEYGVTVYDASGEFHPADEAAALLGLPVEAVYKTLVVLRDGDARARPMIVMAPAGSTIDLKALAQSTGNKKLRMATQKEAERLTGMQAGGISALGLTRPAAVDIYIDERAAELPRISISGGKRGVEIDLPTTDLMALTGARAVKTG